jgi:hypothetical protein
MENGFLLTGVSTEDFLQAQLPAACLRCERQKKTQRTNLEEYRQERAREKGKVDETLRSAGV